MYIHVLVSALGGGLTVSTITTIVVTAHMEWE